MSRGDLQEMEVGTKQSKGPVTANAKAGDPMPKLTTGGTPASYEDLGGPSPDNYKPDNDSAKIKEPKIKTVKDVVNKGAKPADPMPQGLKSGDEVELEDTQEIVAETEETTEETVEEETVEIDIEADVNALLGGEELSEEFREKAKTVFEAAVSARVSDINADYSAAFDSQIAEAKESIAEDMSAKVDEYINYLSEQWMEENQVAIESSLKVEVAESFMNGLRGLMEAHNVVIPEEADSDILTDLQNRIEELEGNLEEETASKISLSSELVEAQVQNIFAEASDGLAETQIEKLRALSEGLDYDNVEDFESKLNTLKESYFDNKAASVSTDVEAVSYTHLTLPTKRIV